MEMQRKAFGQLALGQDGAPRRILTVNLPQPYEGVGNALRSTFRPRRDAVPDDMLDLLAKLDRR
jgi:hypothetical protein